MKKLSTLLARRPALLRQFEQANLAFAYAKLSEFGDRIARARLRGEIALKQPAPEAGRNWASLTAITGSQAALDEIFIDEDLMDFADAVAFTTGDDRLDVTFRIEELAEKYLAPLCLKLVQGGVALDTPARAASARGLKTSRSNSAKTHLRSSP